jgi:hypothetical protein
MTSDIEYHRARASRELNLGLTSPSMAAARAHLRLSWLHLERARSLQGGAVAEPPPFILA